ncbi:hypothetical protein FPQ18DRAFT_356855 [Pyronema domesticum]|uniref:Tyrosine--tRNA ligase n=1 Tax=Pyronema omphalodes (strain CBS 100304) TaxID=1076935 RepID=U4LD57_PYROM|nr:hypothetical protein FPQ18DRAFT_356855 [Pyronema domesticum]CCX30054.1 Similar to Tyrosine--tRNA ligase, mitochondrial; acc. no. P48527 [Pyronema omphalodes CBS 100304]
MRSLLLRPLARRALLRPAITTRWQSTSTSLVSELKARGLAESITGPEGQLSSFVDSEKVVAYAGIDPTAPSLHVGHLLPLMNLLHFYLHGHTALSLIGRATGSVGDPSGRSTERDSIEAARLKHSFDSLWAQVDKFFVRGQEYAISRGYDKSKFGSRELLSNGEWLDNLGLVEFLATIGRNVRVGQMLARESVKARMESKEGINYAEFTYQLLQSYDFWHLFKTKNCRLQIGGNDQFGNITAGIDLISRMLKSSAPLATPSESPATETSPAYGLTVPLLTTASGAKFGKSAGNAVWLDPTLTSPFELYQYFVKLPDSVIASHLKIFTLLTPETVDAEVVKHMEQPDKRAAQHLLAKEVVTLIHGPEQAEKAGVMTQLLFPGEGEGLQFSASQVLGAFEGDARLVEVPRGEVVGEMVGKVMRRVGAAKTKGEAENVLKAGGVYVGVEKMKVADPKAVVEEGWLLEGQVLLLRVGKGRFNIVKAV